MEWLTLGMLGALAFLPPLVFAVWVRNHEKHQREPLGAVLGMFAYGGTLGVLSALLLSVVLGFGLGVDLTKDGSALVGLVVIAPLAEELAKGLGLGFVRRRIDELEDGIIYGASIGLGFAATENLLYGFDALADGGVADAVVVLLLRVVSSMLLHASSTALLGYGYGMARLRRQGIGPVLPFYLLAVAMHALYNFLVSGQYLVAFAAAIVMVATAMTILRRQVRRLDQKPKTWLVVR